MGAFRLVVRQGGAFARHISTHSVISATGIPTKLNWNIPSSLPLALKVNEFTTRLVEVPTRVVMPPNIEA